MTGFGDLHEFAWGPRVGSVALSPDGTWVAPAMQTLGDTPPDYLTSIWRADADPAALQSGSPAAPRARAALRSCERLAGIRTEVDH